MFLLFLIITLLNVGVYNSLHLAWKPSNDLDNEQRGLLKIAPHIASGCHTVLVTQGNGQTTAPHFERNSFNSSLALVVVNVDLFEERRLGDRFIQDLWGSYAFTCRAMLIDFTDKDYDNILSFLDTIELWKWPDTRLLLIDRGMDVKSLIYHSNFKNSLYLLYVGLEDKHSESSNASSVEDLDLNARDELIGRKDSQNQGGYYHLRLINRCLYCNGGQLGIRYLPPWKLDSDVPKLFLSLSEQIDNFHGALLRVITYAYFPYLRHELDSNEPGTTVTLLDSVDKRAFDAFTSRANFSYVVRVPKDMIPGVVNSNGTWSGALGVLQQQKVDMTTVTTISNERLVIADYERFYAIDQFIVVSLKPQLLPQYLVIIRPYEAVVWICILTITFIWGVLFWALQKSRSFFTTEENMSLTAAIFYSSAVMLEDPPSQPPNNITGQMLLGWWLVFCLLITTGYRSSLIAHLTVKGTTEPIDTYEDLVRQTNWHWGCDRTLMNGIAKLYFRSKTPVVQQVFRKAEAIDVTIGLKKVLRGGYSLLTSRNRIRTEIESKFADSYGQTPFYLGKRSYILAPDLGWAFRKGAPFRPRFAKLANRLIEAGIIDFWLEDVITLYVRTTKNETKQESEQVQTVENGVADDGRVILRLDHMTGVFLSYLFGAVISSLVFLTEKICDQYPHYKI